MRHITTGFAAIALLTWGSIAWAASKYPGKGVVTIGKGPLPLLVHYLDGSGRKVKVDLRDLSFAQPALERSKELNALAKSPCSKGDVVKVKSAIGAEATGADAAGIGRFVWLIDGNYTSDGTKWQFAGTVKPKDDRYNFNKAKDGDRKLWAEVATLLGAKMKGNDFAIQIDGSLLVGISGICSMNSAGQAIV